MPEKCLTMDDFDENFVFRHIWCFSCCKIIFLFFFFIFFGQKVPDMYYTKVPLGFVVP